LCWEALSASGGGKTPTGATQSNVSKHLFLLSSAGIVTRQKEGQFVYYRMSNPLTMKLCEPVHKEPLNQP
jgi:DNA-binding transcriptional ArsR family regulator